MTIGLVVKSSFISANTSVGSAIAMPSASSLSVTTSTPGAPTSRCTIRPLTVTMVTPRNGTVANAASISGGMPPATGEFVQYPDGFKDGTHLNATGASRVCDLAIEEIHAAQHQPAAVLAFLG